MSLLRFSGVGKQYGDRWVFRNVSLQVSAGERWGVVGRNGQGKTTLFRLVSGDDVPTEGEVWRHPGTRFTLLRQNRGEQSAATVHDAALTPFAELLEMERRLEREAAELAEVDPASEQGQRLLRSYDHHLDQFRRRGGYEMRARSEATLEGLGFAPESWAQPIRSLSGGELGRLRLAQTLLAAPDVLLLDEPTNHLDLRSTQWLEGFLQDYRGTVLVISHDRTFLENLVDHVLHMEEDTAHAYTGGYQSFLEQREQRRELQHKQWQRQQTHVARTEEFIRRNLAGQKTRQARSRRTLLERLDRVERPGEEEQAMAVGFGGARRSGGTVLRLDAAACGFGERLLFRPFSAEVGRGERVAIVGPNGCGKSTLMRALAGLDAPGEGEVVQGVGVKPAYYRQDFTHLNPDQMVWREVSDHAPQLDMQALRGHLARFLFRGEEIEARVGDLSGGEQARVALAIATLQGANLLLLDEPTNHLDIPSREALEAALEEFDGTVVLISHDRAFLSALATRVWGFVDDGGARRVEDFPGGFDEWTEHRARSAAVESPAAVASAAESRAAGRAAPAQPGREGAGLSKNELRRRQRALESLEQEVAALEERIGAVERELADPALYTEGADPARIRALTEQRDVQQTELSELYAAWERLGEELAAAV